MAITFIIQHSTKNLSNLYRDNAESEIFVPFSDQTTNNYILNNVMIISKEYSDEGTTYSVSLTPAQKTHLKKLMTK